MPRREVPAPLLELIDSQSGPEIFQVYGALPPEAPAAIDTELPNVSGLAGQFVPVI